MASHAVGEAFVMITPGALKEVVLPPFALGTSVSMKARGLADDAAAPVVRTVTGEAMRPPSPIDLVAQPATGGGLSASWTRRSRAGWMWPPDSEPPLGEAFEKYRIVVQTPDATATFEASEPQIVIPAEALVGLTGTATISVTQVGDFAESRAATVQVGLG